MNSKQLPVSDAPGGARIKLADVLPLDGPLIVQIFNIYACNLSCKFCHYGLSKEKRPFISTNIRMDLNLFKKSIDEMAIFKNKIKLLRFCGTGESLLDNNIGEMVDYAVKKNIAETVEIITNAIFLTPEISRSFIKSGLSRLRVSIYGIDSAMYEKICDANIDFDKIVENIRYFYEYNKKDGKRTFVYVKTMNCTLRNKHEEEKFIKIFENICDTYAIEHVVPNVAGLDYSRWLPTEEDYTNIIGIKLPEIKVCPQPFHLITINPDGMVIPCTVDYNKPVGDVNKESLYDIWHGETMRSFQRKMLDGKRAAGEICSTCNVAQCRPFPEDILDMDADRLKILYSL